MCGLQVLALLGRLDDVDAAAVSTCECARCCPGLDGACRAALQCCMALESTRRAASHSARQHTTHRGAVAAWVLTPAGLLLADVAGLQQPDGSFAGDEWGEIDTR